jgi:hypothetical protein
MFLEVRQKPWSNSDCPKDPKGKNVMQAKRAPVILCLKLKIEL